MLANYLTVLYIQSFQMYWTLLKYVIPVECNINNELTTTNEWSK